MKKYLIALVLALLTVTTANAQQGVHSRRFTIAGPDASITLTNTSIAWHQISWNVTGTASACTVALDTSSNGTTWTAGGAIAGQTCTTTGSSSVVNVSANYVRINMTALTISAGGSVNVTWDGWVSNPASGGGGTLTSVVSTLPIVVTPDPITATGAISCPTCVTTPTNPGGTPTQLQFNNTTFGGVPGSAVDASNGQITLTPQADGFSALVANPSSQNFGSVFPVININAGTGTITCETLGGFAPAQVCLNGAANQPWLYNLSIVGDGTATAGPTLAEFDTSRSTPNQSTALFGAGTCASVFSSQNGCAFIAYAGIDGNSAVMNILGDHSMTLGFGGASPPAGTQPYLTWGVQGDIPGGYINASTGEVQAGWIPNAFAVSARNGFFSVVDAPAAHKVSITNPGTLSVNYNFALPITPGSVGQVLTSQGGGTTPMIWTNPGTTASNCSSAASPAVCGSASSGMVNVVAAASTIQVNTTAVTSNSNIMLSQDISANGGTRLTVTCNSTPVLMAISAVNPGVSFTITTASAALTNPDCIHYIIID
jgi:hypothetical protein